MIFESFVEEICEVNTLIEELEDMYGKKIRIIQFIPIKKGYKVIYETPKNE